MHGKQSLHKTLQRVRRAEAKGLIKTNSYMEIGNWRFEENSDGDLIVINLETDKTVILLKR